MPSSGVIVVADTDNHRIRLVDPSSGDVTTLAGGDGATSLDQRAALERAQRLARAKIAAAQMTRK